MKDEQRRGSMVVRENLGNMEIAATHHGGIISRGTVIIERADLFDLYTAMRAYLIDRICLECGSNEPGCQCWNDE